MPANYYNISQEEMEALLLPSGFKRLSIPNVVELVYGKVVAPSITLRIYTGISPDGKSRAVGEDAIRLQLFWRDPKNKVHRIGGFRRVNRVQTWQKSLVERITTWTEMQSPECPHCKAFMVERTGRNGDFWGCVLYPNCRGTVSIATAQPKTEKPKPRPKSKSL